MFELKVASFQDFSPWPHSPSFKAFQLVRPGDVVLDVGCAKGHMARELAKKNCKVYGIEIDTEAAEEAKGHCVQVVQGDADAISALPFQEKFFDSILVMDVLEHMKRPDLFLPLLRKHLKPGTGQLICSLPNVARIEFRFKLMFGTFAYEDYGALSKGHLRFFTRASGRQLLEEAGFVINRTLYTGFASMCPVFPNLTAFQFLIVCSRQE